MANRGNSPLRVRVDPEMAERAQDAFPAVKGRSGGVALALRRLLYLAMDTPMPRQYGEKERSHEVDNLEDLIRKLETPPPDADLVEWLSDRSKALLADPDDLDPVDVLRLRSILGRVQLLKGPAITIDALDGGTPNPHATDEAS